MGEDLQILVDTAMVDWARVPDADLVDVCARARLLAARKPSRQGFTPVANTADVLRAFADLSEDHYRKRHQREQAELQARIASGNYLPEPTLRDCSQETRDEAFDAMWRAAGLVRPKGGAHG